MGALMLKNACVVAFPGMHKLQANCQLACVNVGNVQHSAKLLETRGP